MVLGGVRFPSVSLFFNRLTFNSYAIMTQTYDLRNRWYQACTTFCGFTPELLNQFRFDGHTLTKFCTFVRERGYVFTDEDLRVWCVDNGYNYAPLIRMWMSRVPEFRVVTPTWKDPEAITIAIA